VLSCEVFCEPNIVADAAVIHNFSAPANPHHAVQRKAISNTDTRQQPTISEKFGFNVLLRLSPYIQLPQRREFHNRTYKRLAVALVQDQEH
jgi:hypothetical protein